MLVLRHHQASQLLCEAQALGALSDAGDCGLGSQMVGGSLHLVGEADVQFGRPKKDVKPSCKALGALPFRGLFRPRGSSGPR